MNAILKFPKAGKDTEVQREAIGLKIARMLGFSHVTESTLVAHDTGSGKHPCLFIPFGKMEELTNSVQNHQSMRGHIKAEEHDKIEDFGKYSAFFMLCSDPDFIGKKGQNKGLTTDNNDGMKKLYIFDQVFMSNSNFSFDRGLNLIPTSPLSLIPTIARHFMGRNKSVINDSSYEEKVGGVIHLLSKKEDIKTMFKTVAGVNSTEELQSDAKTCLKSFNQRLVSLQKILPTIKVDNKICSIDLFLKKDPQEINLLKKSMLLNELLNKPKLIDKYGYAFRAPQFFQTRTSVRSVSFEGEDVTISLGRRFGRPISEAKKTILEAKGFKVSPDGKSAAISKEALLNLNNAPPTQQQTMTADKQEEKIAVTSIEMSAGSQNIWAMMSAPNDTKNISVLPVVQKNVKTTNQELDDNALNLVGIKKTTSSGPG